MPLLSTISRRLFGSPGTNGMSFVHQLESRFKIITSLDRWIIQTDYKPIANCATGREVGCFQSKRDICWFGAISSAPVWKSDPATQLHHSQPMDPCVDERGIVNSKNLSSINSVKLFDLESSVLVLTSEPTKIDMKVNAAVGQNHLKYNFCGVGSVWGCDRWAFMNVRRFFFLSRARILESLGFRLQ